ncbi:flagellar filament outer layer protein FlaA [Treponema zuelzerae]|uniref:Flagellar filament outer layer protein FlaA n=1 Tax=Teretinema zuelzerae TaxID=156 RepID=A0AAE3JHQ5_9SPIR|nr:flagellar filament outer layer protein FlaA [Teretinema zuelzerae]MCD1653263.1 flagellar filament outer layer protein FlaA [Teretinema zuelzerae]
MKQGGLIIASLVLMFTLVAVPVAAQSQHVNYETYIVDNFDSPDTEWTWIAAGSKFATKGYPVLKYFDGMPNAIRVTQADPEGQYKFLGMEVKFDRKGDNWVDIVPTKPGSDPEKPETYEIPFKGKVSRLDLWVWGAHYAYELQILVRDCNGRVHTVSFGLVNHEGWKNMSVNIPSSIQQAAPYLNGVQQMSFVAFRLRTRPTERVDSFYIFFDQFKALTDTYMDSYDGFELVGTKFSEENKESGK